MVTRSLQEMNPMLSILTAKMGAVATGVYEIISDCTTSEFCPLVTHDLKNIDFTEAAFLLDGNISCSCI